MFEFFHFDELQKFRYYSVPQLLFTDDRFKSICCESKILYSFLLDRCSLSRKRNWYDTDGKLYVYFKQTEAQEMLNIGKDKALALFAELENIGLIIRKKQGQGKPAKIYVCNFSKPQLNEVQTSENPKSEEVGNAEVQTSEKPKSKSRKCRSLKVGKSEVCASYYMINPNIPILSDQSYLSILKKNTENAEVISPQNEETDRIDEMDYQSALNEVWEQIGGDYLSSADEDMDEVTELVYLIAEVYLTKKSHLQVNGINLPVSVIQREFRKLDEGHIQYVLECLHENTNKVKNRRAYLISCLYNAPHSIDGYYDNLVRHDSVKSESYAASYDLEEYENADPFA